MFDKNRMIKGVLSFAPVYQQSSFIENCWLWTDVKCLCRKKNYKVFYVINLMFYKKTINYFCKKSSIKKIALVLQQLLLNHLHLLTMVDLVIVVQ